MWIVQQELASGRWRAVENEQKLVHKARFHYQEQAQTWCDVKNKPKDHRNYLRKVDVRSFYEDNERIICEN